VKLYTKLTYSQSTSEYVQHRQTGFTHYQTHGRNFFRDYVIDMYEHLDGNIVLSPLYLQLTIGPSLNKQDKAGQPGIVSDWFMP